MKKVIIIGSGLGGLATALRLACQGYQVTVLEKGDSPGGRLNKMEANGFRFDLGPSFMSMTYEFEELFSSCGLPNPIKLRALDPLYQVYFEGRERPFQIWKDFARLEQEFDGVEPCLASKAENYLKRGREFYHDTENRVIKTNFKNLWDYLLKISRVPWKHIPYLFKDMWQGACEHFAAREVRAVFSLVAFFLGSTPRKTPAIFSLLNYIEFRHNGYWAVEGGMYRIVEEIVRILREKGVKFIFHAEITKLIVKNDRVVALKDDRGNEWAADLFVCNADAAVFRNRVLHRPQFSNRRMDRMDWSMAPLTIYLGIKGKVDGIGHHNYFLGNNFEEYADTVLTSQTVAKVPYYYVNTASKFDVDCAPPGCENLFILCPVSDLRYKSDWSDAEAIAERIIANLSQRIGSDLGARIVYKKILSPADWASRFNLHRGSGLGLCHNLKQLGALRPRNKDERFKNLYYVGASTIPGTGLPMVVISSRLVVERINNEHGLLSADVPRYQPAFN